MLLSSQDCTYLHRVQTRQRYGNFPAKAEAHGEMDLINCRWCSAEDPLSRPALRVFSCYTCFGCEEVDL